MSRSGLFGPKKSWNFGSESLLAKWQLLAFRTQVGQIWQIRWNSWISTFWQIWHFWTLFGGFASTVQIFSYHVRIRTCGSAMTGHVLIQPWQCQCQFIRIFRHQTQHPYGFVMLVLNCARRVGEESNSESGVLVLAEQNWLCAVSHARQIKYLELERFGISIRNDIARS
jgi:hypothetical protein